ncbi:MAG: PadR family transcriptional regulator [Saprospiraceae bacterium]
MCITSTSVDEILVVFLLIYSTNVEDMKGLGFLEETILLLVMTMHEDAYGFSVSEAYKDHMKKSISISAVHAVLSRLEKKGLIESSMGEATAERGGRRKRIFEGTEKGREVILDIRASRQKLWSLIPNLI